MCTCGEFTTLSAAAADGSWSGLTYTAPAGCTILAANARRSFPGGSGCDGRWPCDNGNIAPDGKTVQFPALTVGEMNWKFRIILCC
jgi:hypothetical protein